MRSLVLDTIEQKDKIGKELIREIGAIQKSLKMVSPYISNIDNLLELSKIENIQVICNAKSNSCNPYLLKELISKNYISIKSRSDIHAKVYLLDKCLFISSSNATPNGLGIGTIEAAAKSYNKDDIGEVNVWFNNLWNDSETIDVSEYSEDVWEELKSNWDIKVNKSNRKKVSIYDLIITKKIPKNISFMFWSDTQDTIPSQDSVKTQAIEDGVLGLPENINNWDYWIESENHENYILLEKILSKYHNQTFINIKENKNGTQFFIIDNFLSTILDQPIKFEHNQKKLLLSLYRKDGIYVDFKFDKKIIKLLNNSLNKNINAWKKYRSSENAIFGVCSTEQLYSLVKNCKA